MGSPRPVFPCHRTESFALTRIAIIAAAVLVTFTAVGVGVLAWADGQAKGKLPAGARVASVDVGGLTREQALARARSRIGALTGRPVHVQLRKARYTMTAEQADVRVDPAPAVQRAYAAGREGSFLSRGWRKLSGGKVSTDIAVPVTADRPAIRAFVERIERKQARKPVDAALKLSLTNVSVTSAKAGRRLAAREALVARLTRRLTSNSDDRTVRAKTAKVKAKVTADEIFDVNPVAVTVSRSERRARLFRRGKLVKAYTVAVGSAEYPTPTGQFVVQTKQVNPVWSVPNSSWAGSLAGQTIPGGDPRNPLVARWIGFNGSVGFHGTSSSGSLGSAASHGCIRMAPSDVIDLYEHVKMQTPVYVA